MKQTLLKVFLSMTAVLLFGLNVSAQETTGNQSTGHNYFTSTLPENYTDIKFYLAVSGVDENNKQTTVSATVYDNANDYDFEVNLPASGSKVLPTKATVEALMHNVASLNVGKSEARTHTVEVNISGVEGVSAQTLGTNGWLKNCYTFPTSKTLPIKVIDYNHPQAAKYPEEYEFSYSLKRTTNNDGSVKIEGEASSITDAHNAWYLITKGYTNQHVTASQTNNGDSRVVVPAGAYIQIGNEKLTVNSEVVLSQGVFDMSSMRSLINENSTLSTIDNPTNTAIIYLPAGSTLAISSSLATLNENAKIIFDLTSAPSTITLNGTLTYLKNNSNSNYNLLQALLTVFDNLVGTVGASASPNITVQFGEPTEKYIQVYKGVSTPEPNLMSHEEFAKVLQSYPNSVGYVRTQFATPAHIEESTAEGVKNVVIEYSVGKFGYKFYESSNLVLVDPNTKDEFRDFYTPEDFMASTLHYERTNVASRYNSACLPFALEPADVNGGVIYTFSNHNPNDERKENKHQVYFTKQPNGIEPGIPCIVEGTGAWTASKTDAKIVKSPIMSTNMQGSFKKIAADNANGYKLNGGIFKKVVSGTSNIYAFRSYLILDESLGFGPEENPAEAKNIDIVFLDEEPTAISTLPTVDNTIEDVYSISGAKLCSLRKGVNIVKMADGSIRKVVIK